MPVSELNVLEVEFLMLNEFSLFVTLEELQDYGDQLLSLWTKEHIEQGILSDDDDALTGPIRRRARNLSIDKHADESHDRVYKKTVV